MRRLVINRFAEDGLRILADDCLVRRCLIGTDATGAADLGNSFDGVYITGGASHNVVGGATAAARNVISGNDFNGVEIDSAGTTGNRVSGNRIGLAATSAAALGNTGHGVLISGAAADNVVGGTAAGAGNVIAHNTGIGVSILAGSGHSVLANRIFDNGLLGIDLLGNGVTANDLNDPDAGANDLLNFPELTLARVTAAGLRVSGSVNVGPNETLRIEFFANPAADPSGHGEGRRFLGFITAATSAANTVEFTTVLAGSGVLPGQFITATATDGQGNMSEFSLAVAVT